ncbi:MAG: hypothetical protein HY291_10015 [Planctomycetes bacterium]|nr:hypothetical protein [Planctomycetota bacterium]
MLMNMRTAPFLFVACGLAVACAAAEDAAPAPAPSPTKTADAAAEPKKDPPAPLPELTAEERERVQKLIAQLDDEEFATREEAGKALAAFGPKAEKALKAAFAASGSAEARLRLERILNTIEALTVDLNGDWEETFETIEGHRYYRIAVAPAGGMAIAPTDYTQYRQYTFDETKYKDGELHYHEVCNPGYEFDARLKFEGKDKLQGTLVRRSDQRSFTLILRRLTEKEIADLKKNPARE